jgi:hypothetical protein
LSVYMSRQLKPLRRCVRQIEIELVGLTFGHANLLRHLHNLNLNIHLHKLLRQRVDLDETRVNSASKTAEFRHEANVSLLDGLVRVRAAETAGDRTESPDRRAEGVDHAAVPAGARGIFGVGLDDLGVGRLQVFAAGRLDVDDGVVETSEGGGGVAVRGAFDGVAVGVGEGHCGGWWRGWFVCVFLCLLL